MSDQALRQGIRAIVSGGVTQLDDLSLETLIASCRAELAARRVHVRDPRREPRVGDVVECAEHLPRKRKKARRITEWSGKSYWQQVRFETCDPLTFEKIEDDSNWAIILKSWRDWARGGTVLHVAESKPAPVPQAKAG